ncbi:hypothetical protein AB834_00315 [PVC group bacterium (ex Bugula neritina AB1)]|nr:hypothetical protein AB834_00315 [PVC group bacterium (ex Bugula neritina AB1)]
MGCRPHPNSFRRSSVESYLRYNKLIVFKGYNFFSSVFYSKINSNTISGNLINTSIIFEKTIQCLLKQVHLFTNRVVFFDSAIGYVVYVEAISDVNNKFFNKNLVNKILKIVNHHCRSAIFKEKPIVLIFNDLVGVPLASSTNYFSKLDKKNAFFNTSTLIQAGFISNSWCCAPLFADVFAYTFTNISNHAPFFSFIDQLFFFIYNSSNSNFLGIRIEVRGRINFNDKSQVKKIFYGKMPFKTVSSYFMDYGYSISTTSYGVFGIRIFFSYLNN